MNLELKNRKIRMKVRKKAEKTKQRVRTIQMQPPRKHLFPLRVNPILNQLIQRKPKKNLKLQIILIRLVQKLRKRRKLMKSWNKKLVLLLLKVMEDQLIKMQKAKMMAQQMKKIQKFNREELIKIIKKNLRK
jgi:hypothetical protein